MSGNDKAKLVFTGMGEAIGIVLAMLVNAFNFPLYLIAGGVIDGWDLFAPAMIAETSRRSFTFRMTETRVEKAQLGNLAGFVWRGVFALVRIVTRSGGDQCGWESISVPVAAARCW